MLGVPGKVNIASAQPRQDPNPAGQTSFWLPASFRRKHKESIKRRGESIKAASGPPVTTGLRVGASIIKVPGRFDGRRSGAGGWSVLFPGRNRRKAAPAKRAFDASYKPVCSKLGVRVGPAPNRLDWA